MRNMRDAWRTKPTRTRCSESDVGHKAAATLPTRPLPPSRVTPRSAASTPTGWPGTASRPNHGPPEDEEIFEAVPELAIAAEIDAVPSHLRGNRPAAAARGPGIESQRNGVAACRKGRRRV